ncbi:hypothetical protein K1719_036652 [Acacia pycnantha]|nr:hypothetical protein K1719_036652 [Acacia pycnantha]
MLQVLKVCLIGEKAHTVFVTSVAHKLFLCAKHTEIWRIAIPWKITVDAVHKPVAFLILYHPLFMSTIRGKIIPHAVSWFTGEAIQGEEFGDLEGDEDEDIVEDDEGEEEDDEDKDD